MLTSRFGQQFTSTPEIGAATGIEFLGDGQLQAAAEPVRRGGGAAAVVCPAPRRIPRRHHHTRTARHSQRTESGDPDFAAPGLKAQR